MAGDGKDGENAVMDFEEFTERYWHSKGGNFMAFFEKGGLYDATYRQSDYYKRLSAEHPKLVKRLFVAIQKRPRMDNDGFHLDTSESYMAIKSTHKMLAYECYAIMKSYGATDADLHFMQK
jgi:hypothetical protein